MLAFFDVRVGEVAGLTLEDLNWQEPALRVAGKWGRILILPMPVDVGETLVEYLQIRTAEPGERGVCIRTLSPFKALNRVGIDPENLIAMDRQRNSAQDKSCIRTKRENYRDTSSDVVAVPNAGQSAVTVDPHIRPPIVALQDSECKRCLNPPVSSNDRAI